MVKLTLLLCLISASVFGQKKNDQPATKINGKFYAVNDSVMSSDVDASVVKRIENIGIQSQVVEMKSKLEIQGLESSKNSIIGTLIDLDPAVDQTLIKNVKYENGKIIIELKSKKK